MPDPEPVFAEPWEARAFALVVALQDQGVIDAKTWARTLGAEIAARSDLPYYQAWLAALERLLVVER